MKPETTPDPAPPANRQVAPEEIDVLTEKLQLERNCPAGSADAIRLEAASQLQGEAESRPVSGTPSRPYIDEPAQPVRGGTKSSDPAESGAQTRSATEGKVPSGRERNQ